MHGVRCVPDRFESLSIPRLGALRDLSCTAASGNRGVLQSRIRLRLRTFGASAAKRPAVMAGLKFLAPRVGFEPTTLRLTAGCSAVELPRNTRAFKCASGYYSRTRNPRKALLFGLAMKISRPSGAAAGRQAAGGCQASAATAPATGCEQHSRRIRAQPRPAHPDEPSTPCP